VGFRTPPKGRRTHKAHRIERVTTDLLDQRLSRITRHRCAPLRKFSDISLREREGPTARRFEPIGKAVCDVVLDRSPVLKFLWATRLQEREQKVVGMAADRWASFYPANRLSSSFGVTSLSSPVDKSKTNPRMTILEGIHGCDLSFSTCFCVA
jgi:hypothetical protein